MKAIVTLNSQLFLREVTIQALPLIRDAGDDLKAVDYSEFRLGKARLCLLQAKASKRQISRFSAR